MKHQIPDLPLPPWEKAVLFAVLTVIAMVSAFFSFQGALLVLEEVGQGLFIRIGAGVYALGSWAVLFILWRHSFLTVPFVKREQVVGALVSIAMTSLCAIGLSGAVNVAFIAGGEAQRAHMTMMTETAASVSDAHHNAVQRVGDLAQDIGGRSADFLGMAEADRASGRYSGFRGGGAFTDSAETIGAGLAGLKARIDETVAESDAASEQARRHLEIMRETALRRDQPPKVRIAAIENEVSALRGTLATVSAERLAGLISRELNRMTRLANGMKPTSPRADIRAGQAKAIAVLQARMADTAATLSEAVDALSAVDDGDALRFDPMSVMQAIFAYGDQFIPQWIGGVAIDLAPLVIVLLLTLRVQMLRGAATEGGPSDLNGAQIELAMAQVARIIAASQGISAAPRPILPPRVDADPARPAERADLPPPPLGDGWERKDG